jgi:hypothetical protein
MMTNLTAVRRTRQYVHPISSKSQLLTIHYRCPPAQKYIHKSLIPTTLFPHTISRLRSSSSHFHVQNWHLSGCSEVNSSRSLSACRSVKLDVIRKLRLLSGKVTGASALGRLNLNTQNLGRELEDLVLYFAILLHISVFVLM